MAAAVRLALRRASWIPSGILGITPYYFMSVDMARAGCYPGPIFFFSMLSRNLKVSFLSTAMFGDWAVTSLLLIFAAALVVLEEIFRDTFVLFFISRLSFSFL